MIKKYRALVFITTFILLSTPVIVFGQTNELHAIFIEKNRFTSNTFKESPGSRDYTNINISGESSPQNEPSIAISRINPDIVVAAWRDFRLGYIEPDVVRRIGYSRSTDGGITWSTSQLLPDPAPDHISQSDPVVICDMDGNFYISSTSRQPVTYYNREMLLYKSTDNGQTFQLHATAVPGSGIQGEDKEWIFVDPVETNPTYNQLMIAWRSFGPSYGIKFRKSDIGGSNWSSTVNVSDFGSGQGANVATGTDGQIIVVWTDYGINYDISYDNGISFGSDRSLSTAYGSPNNSFPFICVDYSDEATRGNVYVVWADNRLGSDDIWFQRSEDGGETWLDQPVRINASTAYHQTWPVIRCDSDGTLYSIYYDEGVTPGLLTTKLAFSDDAGDTWTNQILSDVAFQGNAPNSNVRFGDYIELDTYDGKVIPVWTDDRAGGYDQEIYTAIVDITSFTDENPVQAPGIRATASPNPFYSSSRLELSIEKGQMIQIYLHGPHANRIETIENRYFETGDHIMTFGKGLAAGFYYLVIVSEEAQKSIVKVVKI